MKTVGELKQALATVDDAIPLGLCVYWQLLVWELPRSFSWRSASGNWKVSRRHGNSHHLYWGRWVAERWLLHKERAQVRRRSQRRKRHITNPGYPEMDVEIQAFACSCGETFGSEQQFEWHLEDQA